MDALGIPAALHTSAGAAQREAYRHFFTATIEPLGALIEAELSEKLERSISLYFPAVFESDLSARSRAFSSMIKDGLDVDYAAGIVGLPLPVKMAPEPEPVAAPTPVVPACYPPSTGLFLFLIRAYPRDTHAGMVAPDVEPDSARWPPDL